MVYDDIIIGAGSSGAVIAARLSEDPARKVLLLEAGPDYASLAETPADLRGPDPSLTAHDWKLRAFTQGERSIPYPRARAVGGCSAVNGAVALRGVPADYDEWAALGNPGWSWSEVLPYFKRLEDDELGPSEHHGAGGPIPIRRYGIEQLCDTQLAAHRAFVATGFAEVRDHNEPDASGVGPIPLNLKNGVRISTALGYLLPARGRTNLEIRGECRVARLVIERDRVTGVEVDSAGSRETLCARRVTVSAGAIHTPGILLRSGIGPRDDVRRIGVEPILELPGVGTRLCDHPGIGIYCVPKPGCQQPDEPNHQTMVRYTVQGSNEWNDMQLYLFGRIALKGSRLSRSLGADQTYLASASLVRPRAVGRLVIDSADPDAAPRIDLNFSSDPEDERRLGEGLRACWQALHSAPLAERIERIPFWSEDIMSSDEALIAAIAHSVGTAYHPVSTARMGPDGDEGAVVDPQCRVRGIDNLRIADASVMPTIPRANTNLPCMMIGERVADWMRE